MLRKRTSSPTETVLFPDFISAVIMNNVGFVEAVFTYLGHLAVISEDNKLIRGSSCHRNWPRQLLMVARQHSFLLTNEGKPSFPFKANFFLPIKGQLNKIWASANVF